MTLCLECALARFAPSRWFPAAAVSTRRFLGSDPIRWGLVKSSVSLPAPPTTCTGPSHQGGCSLQRPEQVFQRFGPLFSHRLLQDKLWAELVTRYFEIPSYFERISLSALQSQQFRLWCLWPSAGKESGWIRKQIDNKQDFILTETYPKLALIPMKRAAGVGVGVIINSL